jgi:hypothetical protein
MMPDPDAQLRWVFDAQGTAVGAAYVPRAFVQEGGVGVFAMDTPL